MGPARAVDIAGDPLERRTLPAKGKPGALSVIALSGRGPMFDPGPCVYMSKLAGGAEIADLLDVDRSLSEMIGLIAERRRVDVALLGQHGFQRALAQLGLRQFGMVMVELMIVTGISHYLSHTLNCCASSSSSHIGQTA